MKFGEFMSLTPGTGVIFDDKDCVVAKVNDTAKGDVDKRTGRIEPLYPVVFTDFPNSTHNQCVLERMKIWDPFEKS